MMKQKQYPDSLTIRGRTYHYPETPGNLFAVTPSEERMLGEYLNGITQRVTELALTLRCEGAFIRAEGDSVFIRRTNGAVIEMNDKRVDSSLLNAVQDRGFDKKYAFSVERRFWEQVRIRAKAGVSVADLFTEGQELPKVELEATTVEYKKAVVDEANGKAELEGGPKPEDEQAGTSNADRELAIAHAVIKKQKRKLQGRPDKGKLQEIADKTRKKNGELSYRAIGRECGTSHTTVSKWCKEDGIS